MNRFAEILESLESVKGLCFARLRDPLLLREQIVVSDGTRISFTGDSSPELVAFVESAKANIEYLVQELQARL